MLQKNFLKIWLVLFWGWVAFPAVNFLVPETQWWKNYFYIFVLLPWLLLLPSNFKKREVWLNPIFLVSVLLISYLMLTSLWSSSEKLYFLFYLKQVIYIIAYLSAGALLIERFPHLLDYTFKAIMLAGSISIACTIVVYIQMRVPHGLSDAGVLQRLEGVGMLVNPLVAAQNYGVLCLISLFYALNKAVSPFQKKILLLLSLVSFIVVIWTRSRGPSLYLPFSILLLIMFSRRAVIAKALKYFGGFVVACAGVLFLTPGLRSIIFNRSFELSLSSIDLRVKIWTSLISEAIQSPFFGVGARKHLDLEVGRVIFQNGHSIWVETFYYGGFVGLGLLVMSYLLFTLKAYKFKKESILLSWLVFGTLAISSNGASVLSRPDWQWLALWVPVAFICAFHNSFEKKQQIN